MKFIYLFTILLIYSGCKSQKEAFSLEKLQEIKSFSLTNCPEDGACILELIPDKSMVLKKDNFGQHYGETITSEDILVKYTYERKVPENVADAHYSESYYFNLPKNTQDLDLYDADLQKVNLVVDRQCFCKGTAGFFKITNGNLKLSIKKNELTLSGKFSHKNLPLLITEIKETVSLEQ